MIGTDRNAGADPANAFFPGGIWEFRRSVEGGPSGSERCVVIDLEGVYRDAVVRVNSAVAARWPYGYSRVCVPIDHLLRPGANELRIDARANEDSRWYSGAGIHRDVWLLDSGRLHLSPEGLAMHSSEIEDDGAVVTVDATVQNHSSALRRPALRVEITDSSGAVVAGNEAPVTILSGASVTARRRLWVADPRRWRLDDPQLYVGRATLLEGEDILDRDETTFGIRSLALDPRRGLRINGEPVLLRGACVHHDNGPLGAAAFGRADERRVELLKAAGFNAIRSAHNPMSRAMLDACDRLGVLVMDEAFDMWTQPKSADDYAGRFADWWEADVEAMVRNARNHPSVVFYSIGNEIPDGSTVTGLQVGRALADKVRSLDASRYVTQAVTGLLVGGPELFSGLATGAPAAEETGVNTLAADLGEAMQRLVQSPVVDAETAEAFAALDVAGYNYMESRYPIDAELHPDRIIVGTETHPPAIAEGWAKVLAHPNVIGDFTWTGWDYLGEVGIGRRDHSEGDAEPGISSFLGPYPWRAAWCGDIDITGRRRPQSYFREVVFGLRLDPYITVVRPAHRRRPNRHSSPWSFSDVVASWSWPGHEGDIVDVEVYAAADDVELLLDGQSLGRQPAGAATGYRSAFQLAYRPGELQAIARVGGEVIGRASLSSASDIVLLEARPERREINADHRDLAYIGLSLVDEAGTVHPTSDRRVEVVVEGPGVLQAVGSADPASPEPFTGTGCSTFDGRALAVVRPTGPGTIIVTATAPGCEPQVVRVLSRAAPVETS
jgi:beta-galactosidase